MPASPAVGLLERIAAALERQERRELRGRRELRPIDDHAPRRVGFAMLLPAVPGLARQFREVPGTYVEPGEDGVRVRCPCGERPLVAVEERGVGSPCEGCERLYLGAGRRVYVAYLKVDAPAAD